MKLFCFFVEEDNEDDSEEEQDDYAVKDETTDEDQTIYEENVSGTDALLFGVIKTSYYSVMLSS